MRYFSLFSGVGGFDLGLDRAGMICAAQVEKDDYARGVLFRHWPDVPKFDDVCTFGRSSIDGSVDLICGGFPCQDLSVAGKRSGLAGERSGLFHEFMRIADDFAPRWLIIENVPGLLSSNGGRDMGIVTGKLAELGYGWAYRVLNAQYWGVPQRRRRVFIVGCLGYARRAAKVLFEPESLPGYSGQSSEAGEGVAAGAGGGIDEGCPRQDTFVFGWNKSASQTMRVDTSATDVLQASHSSHPAVAMCFESRLVRNGRGAPDVVTPPLKAQNGGNGKGDGAPLVLCPQNQRNEVRTMDVCGALQAQPGMKQSFYYGVRRLMPVECERLQGFPDGWTDGQSDGQRYKQLGNAVAVPVAEWIGRRIMTTSE